MGEQKTTLILLLIFCLILVGMSKIEIIQAQKSEIFIRPDGTVEGTNKIMVDGNYYRLTGNITIDSSGLDHGIYVEKDYITIDGSGYTVQGSGEYATAIQLFERIGVIIKNIHITNWYCGINNPKSNCKIEGNWISNCETGINLAGTANCSFYQNELSGNRDDVVLTTGHSNNFSGNNIGKLVWSTAFIVPGENYFEGNYWGEYEGVDDNVDGFGDIPFLVYWVDYGDRNLTCYDNQPLMEPNVIPEFPSWTILPLVLTITLFSVVVKRKLHMCNPELR